MEFLQKRRCFVLDDKEPISAQLSAVAAFRDRWAVAMVFRHVDCFYPNDCEEHTEEKRKRLDPPWTSS